MEGFSKIVAPLIGLMKKDSKFEWGDKHEGAFQDLKEKFTTTPVLAIPKIGEKFTIFSDISYQGLGCVLIQNDEVTTYGSKYLKPNELKLSDP